MSQLSVPVTLLNAVTATGASAAACPDGAPFTVVVSGITTATVAVEGSVDGTNWTNVAAALTANGSVSSLNPWKYVRANCTAYTSGTITAKIIF